MAPQRFFRFALCARTRLGCETPAKVLKNPELDRLAQHAVTTNSSLIHLSTHTLLLKNDCPPTVRTFKTSPTISSCPISSLNPFVCKRTFNTCGEGTKPNIEVCSTPNPNAKMFKLVNCKLIMESGGGGESDNLTISYNSLDACDSSPLAYRILSINGVQSLLIRPGGITVLVQGNQSRYGADRNSPNSPSSLDNWALVEPLVRFELLRFVESGEKAYVAKEDKPKKYMNITTGMKRYLEDNDISYDGSHNTKKDNASLDILYGKNKPDFNLIKEPEKTAGPESIASDDAETLEKISELIDTHARPAIAADGGDIEIIKFVNKRLYVYMKGACEGCPSSSITLKNGIHNMLKYFVDVDAVIQCDENGDPLDDDDEDL